MTARIDEKRLADLRTAAEVAIRMASLQPHTVHMRPDELVALLEEVYIARAQERPHAGIACRDCGCTDDDCAGCIERTGQPCWWIERDLCSACTDKPLPELLPGESLAASLCVRYGLPGAMVIALDANGALHLGCTAVKDPVKDPVTERFVELAKSLNIAIERGVPGFAGISREQAIDIARRCARAKPQSYFAEPFEPHEWVVDAIIQAAATLPSVRANCGHCGLDGVDDVDTIRAHSFTCEKSPIVQLLARALEALIKVPIVRVADTGYTCIGCGSRSGIDATTCADVNEPCKPDCWVARVETAIAEIREAPRG